MKLRNYISVFLILSIIFTIFPRHTSASSSWRAGRIIDDVVFYNKTTMSINDIQAFLNSRQPKCDTWGGKPSEYGGGTRAQYGASKGYPAPFICLKDYKEDVTTKANNLHGGNAGPNAKSSAQIIWDVAQQFNINPQALLVMLHKESDRLLTDDWPWSVQYRAAMGYGCPDSGPNYSANCNASYYGFYNQMYNAARQFRLYANNPQNYRYKAGQNNTIQYAPDPACGSSSVFIQNQATAGLYNYTPYQPNAATMSVPIGQTAPCGAYGNKNFWYFFNSWFGESLKLNLGVRPSGDSAYARAPCTTPYLSPGQVARLYHPDIANYIYTTNPQEVCSAVRLGYIYDGVVFNALPANTPGTSPVYRLSGYDRHVFTTASSVRDEYIGKGYRLEGVAFYVYTQATPTTDPVWCLVKGSAVYYTSSGGEKADLMQQGFTNVGTAFLTPSVNKKSIASRYTDSSHRRIYTSNSIEKSQMSQFGFTHEGRVAEFGVDSYPNTNNSPLYRLRTNTGLYFYTPSRIERDLAVINHNYYSEGVAFYTPGNASIGDLSVYRIMNPGNAHRIFTTSSIERDLAIKNLGWTSEGVAFYAYRRP